MRFEELRLQVPDDELTLRFHARLTVLAGLSAAERRELTDGILAALTGGTGSPTATALRYLDGNGELATVVGRDGRIQARRDDGTPVPEPLGTIAPDAKALRSLMLLDAAAVGGVTRQRRDDEPDDLREARDSLEEMTAELDAAVAQNEALTEARQELAALDSQLVVARAGAARRQYALVLAAIERVRAEAAAVEADAAGIEADRELLANVDPARELAERWEAAASDAAELEAASDDVSRVEELADLVTIPAELPDDLPSLVEHLERTADRRAQIDRRLQDLAVSKLPAPSDPVVARLGLTDQEALWGAAHRLDAARSAMRDFQLSLGGLEVDAAPTPDASETITAIEEAHRNLEEAEQAAEKARVAGLAGTGAGVVGAVIGLAAAPVLAPVGLVGAAAAAGVGLIRPRSRRSRAERAEAEALAQAEAPTYLAFHLRRVDATVDPDIRRRVESTRLAVTKAETEWVDLVGSDADGRVPDVTSVLPLEDEIRAYHRAVEDLGETAEEMEHLRAELVEQADPEWRAARAAVAELGRAYQVPDERLDQPGVVAVFAHQVRRGTAARSAHELTEAQARRDSLATELGSLLERLGFDVGELTARVGALEWAASRAVEREEARLRARPRDEIDTELRELQTRADDLRQPEWDDVTAADADLPDIPTLEARKDELNALLATGRSEVDLERLTDRRAALSRRVASLEARYGDTADRDPNALAEMQQKLIGRLTAAAHAGPHGDPVPVVLDEALAQVPADRVWDQLDLLHRLSERHQLIFLTDDAFVAAWARQRALDGTASLLAPEHEPV